MSLNILTFQLIDRYQEVLIWTYSKTKIQNVFYGVTLDILILQKNIQKELEKLIKNLLSILLIQKKVQRKIKSLLVLLMMMELSFLCKKKILARLK